MGSDKDSRRTAGDELRRLAEEELRVRIELEREIARLSARVAELDAANQELEAFNYTVAHDLRNPLNVVSSYCQVLKEMCGSKLDAQCQGYLLKAYNGTLTMNRLIEALLNFSRLTHVELKSERVDLSRIAQEIAAVFKGAEAERRVEFRIADGIVVHGDAALLRVILTNLFDNAWKYTGMREDGVIEFGSSEVEGEPVYFVRDNGIGFDMADAARLFLPFQRLPGSEEYRGFGIGLATVARILRRHHGRVWAESVPDKGSTVYFALPA